MLWYWFLGGVSSSGEPYCQSTVCRGFLWLITMVVAINVSRLLMRLWHRRHR